MATEPVVRRIAAIREDLRALIEVRPGLTRHLSEHLDDLRAAEILAAHGAAGDEVAADLAMRAVSWAEACQYLHD